MKVYLIGAGLGNSQYLTQQAKDLLNEANILIYDALVDESILNLVPTKCRQIYVGKRGGEPSTPQTEINRLLVHYAQKNQTVIRLKNGDPFIFGRAREEIEALKKANCKVEIIPGLSSAITAPLLAGIPLTDKLLSRSFSVITAHEPDQLDWNALARIDTIVILMGGRNLNLIVKKLTREGKPLSCPIAIIKSAGTEEQKVWVSTLETIVETTQNMKLSPSIMVIGEVVNLRMVSNLN
ncbi:uroporphyrinogen-III C-methyltransferase [Dactylococcopsis salina]|uniref:uroporphyrinogen-III C-methyltransferase n=2 Tax=Dactylococcopsis salina TaxID=292566 RepID=K9YRN7_DACS8|nr:uroporphyrinogen-III C-methyltransferase [Dactylococcopsis salina]AFZ49616.1 uroporphyrin-III C-methyltransferase [Dactylococcopsis salina PCC 8305]